ALGGSPPTLFTRLNDALVSRYQQLWREHVGSLNGELIDRAAGTYTRLTLEDLLGRLTITDAQLSAALQEMKRLRARGPVADAQPAGHHHGAGAAVPTLAVDPHPALNELQTQLTQSFARGLLLWPSERAELTGFGGELDQVMQMPGWTNVWTMPIQNRVDML